MAVPYYSVADRGWGVRAAAIVLGLFASRLSAQLPDSVWIRPHRLEAHDELTVLTGFHQGRFGFAELGIGRSVYGVMHHPFGASYFIATEVRADRPELWGVKVGAYLTGGPAFGMQVIHYMEGDRSMQVLRPEIGIGLFKARITYAYNWRLTQPRIDGVNTHQLSIGYAWRIKRLRADVID